MNHELHRQAYQEAVAELALLRERIKTIEAVAQYHGEKVGLHSSNNTTQEKRTENTTTSTNGETRFANMKQRAAAAIVLREAGRPLKTADIADGMLAGGYATDDVVKLRTSLFTSMIRAPRVFQKAGRGLWKLAPDRTLRLPTQDELAMNGESVFGNDLDEDQEEPVGSAGASNARRSAR